MEAITIVLNGVEVSGYAGMTILDLARESGVYIPTLCYDPNLTPAGACRICIVEDERNGALLASCVAPISPGMVINTSSPRVLEHRKKILKLLLASHPDTCMVCDKGNRCQLRKLAAEMGIGLIEFPKIPQPDVIEELNPFIERDLSKCIMCGKCIRADQELVVEGAIDYLHRGAAVRPATFNDMPLEKSECTFCGTCVAICPTGAIMERERIYTGTVSSMVATICPYCGCGCTIALGIKDGRLVYTRPAAESPVNRGTACVRGNYGLDFIHSPERLTHPLVRVGEEFKPVTWDEALSRIATEFKRIKDTYGPDALAVYGSARCTNEENYLFQRFARTVLGTNNIDNGSRLYSAASRTGLGTTIGYAGTTGTLETLEKSQVIMIIGADPEISAPVVAYAIKRAVRFKGAELIVIDPRPNMLTRFAHLWLQLRPGTDIALLNGMAKIIIDEKRLDIEYVTRMTDNFSDWSKSLESYTLGRVEEITGIHRKEIQKAARLLAGAGQASIVYGTGITQQPDGTGAVIAIANLSMLTGNTGRRGGIFVLQRECNAHGASDMGSLPAYLPGYQSVEDAQARKRFEERWRTTLPQKPGLTVLEMMEAAGSGRLKGMLIIGENPVASLPRPSNVKKSLTSLEFLVVADMFLSETARLANLVLPAASFAEKEGTFTNFESRTQSLGKAKEPPGESLPDGEIILKLARAMGMPMPYNSMGQVMEEIEMMVPFYRPMGRTEIGNLGLEPGEASEDLISRRLHKGLFPSGFGRFSPVEYAPPKSARDGYPFTLIIGSSRYHFGTGSRSSRSARLRRHLPAQHLEINPEDAAALGLREGEGVKIISACGEIVMTPVISEKMPRGMLFAPLVFPTGPIYELFDPTIDARAKSPSLKSCAVRLEKVATDDKID